MALPSWPEVLQAPLRAALFRAWGAASYPFQLPLGSRYGWRLDPFTKERRFHSGIDLPLPRGTPVIAMFAGTVARVDYDHAINGRAVHLQPAPGLIISYLHLDTIGVARGQRVARGARLGTVGSTGRSTGPHLHLTVTYQGKTLNPEILYPGQLFRKRS